jgi:hypothetical protein
VAAHARKNIAQRKRQGYVSTRRPVVQKDPLHEAWVNLKITMAVFVFVIMPIVGLMKLGDMTSPQSTTDAQVLAVTTESVETPEQTKDPMVAEREAILAKVPTACEPYVELIQKYDWDHKLAAAVMAAESSCIPTRDNMDDHHVFADCEADGSHGLFQIAICWKPVYNVTESLYDPETNIELAYKIWQRTGSFDQWGAYSDGRYKQYLAD